MRIGIFTDTYFPQVSGVSTSIKVLTDQLRKMGHTVIIFTTTDPKATEEEEDIVRLASIPFFAFKDRRIALSGAGKAFRIAKKYNLDIIHTQTEFSLGLLAKALGGLLGIPTVHTYHTMYEKYLHYIADGKLLTPTHVGYLTRNFCNQTHGVIAPSQMTKDTLLGYGVLQEIHVIPTGISIPEYDEDAAKALREKLGYSRQHIVLLSLSRLSKEKNIMALVRSMPKLLQQDTRYRLCIVGDGPEKAELEAVVRQLNLEAVVSFVGEVKNEHVGQYYQMADVYLNASESETQGLTYLEALVNRLPVIAKETDYLKEIISRPAFGKLFKTDEELANTVISFVSEKAAREASCDTQHHLLEDISSETFARRVLSVYEGAIAGYDWEKEHEEAIMDKFNIFKWNEEDDEWK